MDLPNPQQAALQPGGDPADPGAPVRRVALLAVFLVLALLATRQVGSHDAGFHLRAGEWILDGNGWPRTDPFTFTVSDHPYVDTSWGYQVLLVLLYRVGGPSALTLLHVALALIVFLLIERSARLTRIDGLSLPLFLLLGALAAEPRLEVRPEWMSYTYLALALYLLRRHAAGRAAPLWLLPLILLAWANSHSLFVLGWVATACFAVGLLLRDRRPDGRLLAWGGASILVTLLNPYGLQGVLFPLSLITRFQEQNVFAAQIGELLSIFELSDLPFYPRLSFDAVRLLCLLVLLSLVPLLRRKRYAEALLVPCFLPLALAAARNVPLLVVACLPGLIASFPLDALLRRALRSPAWRRRGARALAGLVVLVALVLGLRVVHDAHYVEDRRKARFGLGWNRLILPVDAAAYAARAGLDGRLFNDLGFGGYLMWALDIPVFIDGRLEVMGEEFYRAYLGVKAQQRALRSATAHYGLEWMVLRYRSCPELVNRLAHTPGWRLVYLDHLAAVYVVDGLPLQPDASARVEWSREAPEVTALPGLGGAPRRGRAARWLAGLVGRQSFPLDDYDRGMFRYFRGEMRAALNHFARAIEDSRGDFHEIYNNLGATLFYLGRREEAARCFRVVLDERPDDPYSREKLAEIAPPQLLP